ncbi:MAG: adenosine kinase [Chitinivibrionales bacterium]|nr:adenosine kinase [Chitinivibrionales bacterium]
MKELMGIRKSKTIVGVGSALVDMLLEQNDQFLENTPGQKGGMTLVDSATIDSIIARSGKQPHIVPGGSACNTIIGIGKLGNPTRFIGKRGRDPLGDIFEQSLRDSGVQPHLTGSTTPTGRVLSVITPDAQRSMFTFLGAAAEANETEIHPDAFADCSMVHCEGYLLFNEKLIQKIIKTAKQSGTLLSLDMASFTVVEASKPILTNIINEYVDILLANEDEAAAYTGTRDESKALELLAEHVPCAVLKRGKRGSLISYKKKVTEIGIVGDGNAVDTTGAGDLWASGFLYGIVNGFSVQRAGKLASLCGYEVCQVIGTKIPPAGWDRIHAAIIKTE